MDVDENVHTDVNVEVDGDVGADVCVCVQGGGIAIL